MKYPLVFELSRDRFPVTVTCRVLKFSTKNYYRWLRNPVTRRDLENAYLTNAAIDVQRDFSATRPNEIWLTDITEHRTNTGNAARPRHAALRLRDRTGPLYSNRIVGYALDERMKASLAVRALRNAIRRRDPQGTMVHSDRGSQFRSKAFVRVLRNNGLTGSMGRVASAGDNAAMESFNSLLQNNVLDTRRWETREDWHLAIVTWIERTYNRRRRQRALGKMTPIEFEALDLALNAT